jgi:hypothetical protein
MIPTMLLFGLVVGRFWAIPVGAVVWAVLVAATTDSSNLAFAAGLGAANTAVAVAVHRAVAMALSEARLRHRS